mgnify:CR=1 FL=1
MDTRISAYSRVRPIVASDDSPVQCLSVENGKLIVTGTNSSEEYPFERVFGEKDSTRDVYQVC